VKKEEEVNLFIKRELGAGSRYEGCVALDMQVRGEKEESFAQPNKVVLIS